MQQQQTMLMMTVMLVTQEKDIYSYLARHLVAVEQLFAHLIVLTPTLNARKLLWKRIQTI